MNIIPLIRKNLPSTLACLSLILYFFAANLHASISYTPSQVYSNVEQTNKIVDRILLSKNISNIQLPQSRETDVKPMHVYELYVPVLGALYEYALRSGRRPPPIVMSTPIKYTPTDVYYISDIVKKYVDELYRDNGGSKKIPIKEHAGKTPVDVYQNLFLLYYKLNRLNGRSNISPSEVYAQTYRAKEDLQYNLLTLSKRLNSSEQNKKRLIMTAVYGMHPNGTVLAKHESGKKPKDVVLKALDIRRKLNELRKRNNQPSIRIPDSSDFQSAKPIDAFLQTQVIIAELNLLKIPMKLHSITNSSKPTSGKSPSDVYYEMNHIDYMLDRILDVF